VGDVPQVDSAFPRLAKAGAELNAIAARFPDSKKLVGARATPSAYAKASPGTYDFIHFAAHGVATVEKPLDSAIILAREGDDYKLYARDIIEHQLSARLVTISSCHGAGMRAYAGEGLVGLAWAFLRAGADQVIAALWEVNDDATKQLMDRMYAEIRAGRDPAVALRAAKLSLLKSNDIRHLARYWAPFVLYSGS
ncbi:MAG TPA: CHAT domain-containing protein, partial [Thermoanaerobaculia bacterium]|nr:CHAT domain-containing protein [Thermoanaerobaculia bacterium]